MALRTAFALLLVTAAAAGETVSQAPERIASSWCLSCHATGTGPRVVPHNSHPVEIDYVTTRAFAERRLREPWAPSSFGSTVDRDFLIDGRVECSSCHVSHDRPGGVFNLRIGADWKSGSVALCRACHLID